MNRSGKVVGVGSLSWFWDERTIEAKPKKRGAMRETSLLRRSLSRAEARSEGSGGEAIDEKSEGTREWGETEEEEEEEEDSEWGEKGIGRGV